MRVHSALVVAAVVVFAAATAAIGVFTVSLLQASAVLLEIIAIALESTP